MENLRDFIGYAKSVVLVLEESKDCHTRNRINPQQEDLLEL